MSDADLLSMFSMPKASKITGRSSSITNAFVNAIVPKVLPNSEQIEAALETLRISSNMVVCCYCGDSSTEWDHLRPVVRDKKPTGYISEIANLVPACGKCNQSKGNKDWDVWMRSAAKLSPTSRGIQDIEERIDALRNFEAKFTPTKVDFESLVPAQLWSEHWKNHSEIIDAMTRAQENAARIAEFLSRDPEDGS